MSTLNDKHYKTFELDQMALPNVLTRPTDEAIVQEFSELYNATIDHVKKFYTNGSIPTGGASQIMIEQASAGVLLPWPQILELLDNDKTRLGILAMCIGRTMLSRSLLLRLGTTNSLGATFLPPELVDCFQSFCVGKSVPTLDATEPRPLNLALLARWKQISGTLLHATYVGDAFSPFDGRTINIERAIEDLNPLLGTYAIPDDAGHGQGARITELRELLRKGAKFAFTLFSQPCLWSFNWYHNREIEAAEGQLQPHTIYKTKTDAARSESMRFKLPLVEIVIWPSLLRIVDEKGCNVVGTGDGVVCGDKVHLDKFPS